MHVPKKLAYCNPARDTSVWASIMVPCSPSLQYLHTCMKFKHNCTLPNRGARARNSVRKNALEVELAQAGERGKVGQQCDSLLLGCYAEIETEGTKVAQPRQRLPQIHRPSTCMHTNR
jgi:hypothetical protein